MGIHTWGQEGITQGGGGKLGEPETEDSLHSLQSWQGTGQASGNWTTKILKLCKIQCFHGI